MLDEIFQAKALLEKYEKDKCSSEQCQQLSLKYLVKLIGIPELLPKIS